jgi:ribosomal protein S18 acetylase RimI-like enzyme
LPAGPDVPSAEELAALPHGELAARLAEAYRVIAGLTARVELLERRAGRDSSTSSRSPSSDSPYLKKPRDRSLRDRSLQERGSGGRASRAPASHLGRAWRIVSGPCAHAGCLGITSKIWLQDPPRVPWHVIVRDTGAVTTAIVQITSSHHAFGQVAALFDEYRAHYGQPPSPQVTHDWLHGQLAEYRMTIAAAIRAGQACGFITATITPASLMLGTAWSIRDLYVAPQCRRSGIARALLQHVVDHARAASAFRVSLQTEAGNTPALRLYTAAGFQAVDGLKLLNLTLADGDHQDSQGTS